MSLRNGRAAPPEVVFFLGFQKTGTTSVHRLLNANAARWPETEVRAYGRATLDLRSAGVDFTHWPTVANLDRLEAAMADHARRFREGGRPRLVISDENIVGREAYNRNGHLLGWCARVLPMLERAFAGHRLLFYFHTRTPSKWLASYYNQSVRRTGVTADFETWCRGVGPVDWARWQARLQATVASPVEFRAMEDDLAEHGFPGATLLDRLGVDRALWPELTIPPRQNPSIGPREIRIMRLINRLPLPRAKAMEIAEYFARTAERRTK